MVHLLPLPGSPRWGNDWAAVVGQATSDAIALQAGGMDGVLVENFGDAPFAKDAVEPVTVAAMAMAVAAVRAAVSLPVGVNVLRNDAFAAIDIAAAARAQFIRVNLLGGAMLLDQGIVEGDAYRVLRRRRALGVDVAIFADVLVKHAVPLGDISLERVAKDTSYRALADALIITGYATGDAPSEGNLARAKGT